jgi:hypothetical protein
VFLAADATYSSRRQWGFEQNNEDVTVILFALGFYRLVRHGHPRGGRMWVGFRDLTFWSFLMEPAHGAGLMVLPALLHISPLGHASEAQTVTNPLHVTVMGATASGLLAVGVHTARYLVAAGAIAWLVYQKLGLGLLGTVWLNLDLIRCIAFIARGEFVLVVQQIDGAAIQSPSGQLDALWCRIIT